MPVSATKPVTDTIDLADFANEKFVTLNEGFATAQSFSQAFDVAGFKPEVVTRLNDIFSLMNLVQAGVGCSLVPKRVKKVFENSVSCFRWKKNTRQVRRLHWFSRKHVNVIRTCWRWLPKRG